MPEITEISMSEIVAGFIEENQKRSDKKKLERLGTIVRGNDPAVDPRLNPDGSVTLEAEGGFAIHRPKDRNLAITPSSRSADLSLGQKPKRTDAIVQDNNFK